MSTTLQLVEAFDRDYGAGPDLRDEADGPGGWRFESQRWLATLNPGRTQVEYRKAIGYLFNTPGVPQRLDELTFTLLLAYRGALAVRVAVHPETEPASRAVRNVPAYPLLDGERTNSSALGPLSPATVNIRLTALRQFLSYCALYDTEISLTPDQIQPRCVV